VIQPRRRSAAPLTILDALADRALFGGLPAFRDLSTWRAWLVFLRSVYGLPLSGDDFELFRRHTGRTVHDPPPAGFPEVVCIVGRQSGKTRVAATVAAFEAVLAEQEPDRTELYAVLVAQNHRAALRTLFGYARAPFENVPVLARSISEIWSDTIRLRSGVTLAAYPCRPAAVRGLRARVAVVDELAFFTATDGRPTDVEMLRALRPALATTGGKLVVLSSPYGQSGALWELHRRHFGRDDSSVLVWQASAADMNPPSRWRSRMPPISRSWSTSFALGPRRSIRREWWTRSPRCCAAMMSPRLWVILTRANGRGSSSAAAGSSTAWPSSTVRASISSSYRA
jgi:hypothetical protein